LYRLARFEPFARQKPAVAEGPPGFLLQLQARPRNSGEHLQPGLKVFHHVIEGYTLDALRADNNVVRPPAQPLPLPCPEVLVPAGYQDDRVPLPSGPPPK
jgi:hypothetical protein